MFCTKCGKEIAEGAKFCGNCGSSIPAIQKENATQAAIPVPEKPVKMKCPKCGAGIQATNINQASGVAFCAACGEVFRLSDLGPPQRPVAPPPVPQASPQYQPYQNTPVPQYQQTQYQVQPRQVYPQAAPANQPVDSSLKPLMILSIIAPVVYAAYPVILFTLYGTDYIIHYIQAVLPYGCLLVQGILAFIQGIKHRKALVIITAVIALLLYAFTNIVIPPLVDGWNGIYESLEWVRGDIIEIDDAVALFMSFYPIVFCILTAVWCGVKTKNSLDN